ncbi:hypothetical protein chiPu_0009073 [Chiloscyllium punctatum]|uniref:Uncharacterized protein n=1 Tax=Chiloscyllium punctatum TaxID=137246 RepID=A0A401SJP5_CHIPU|nr:hypothetical protein [Chiloscyllium punctatum]
MRSSFCQQQAVREKRRRRSSRIIGELSPFPFTVSRPRSLREEKEGGASDGAADHRVRRPARSDAGAIELTFVVDVVSS